ncbi:Phosphoglycerate kinase [Parasponia andersonii]|uniref:Phosphoglycerate kinase n=1 Tax=Parasponia andersonii TaxID=3476 RepID=A0A2P5CH18_PARAD|nr:Phosphoglycerate kinase [Parasponia andersonii]
MGQLLLVNVLQEPLFCGKLNWPKVHKYRPRPCSFLEECVQSQQSLKCHSVHYSIQGTGKVVNHVEDPLNHKAFDCNGEESDTLPYVQTLREFPKKDLVEKVVLVRFDSTILVQKEADQIAQSASNALFTIKYLHEGGAKVILVSDWSVRNNPRLFDTESIADILSSALQLRVVPARCVSPERLAKTENYEKTDILLLDNLSEFKEEVANCPKFAEALSSGVDIFVNESFSQSHKILASNVGVTRFCYACVAGFQFEESLNQLQNLKETKREPYVAIIGGGNILDKAAALHFLASRCEGLVFVGMMCFQIMHVLGLAVPLNLVERGAVKEALDIVQFAESRNVQIVYPKDFLCKNDQLPDQLEIFPSHGILDGWIPVDVGPVTLDEIKSLLSKCKKTLWIGPVKFHKSSYISGASKLAQILVQLSQNDCDVTVVGNIACEAIMKESSPVSVFNIIYNASVVWEFLKGRKLPGAIALDRAYPFYIDWNAVYVDPSKPLVVDIGSDSEWTGNGLFLLGMAKRRLDLNFLGLEINKKLVRRCLDSLQRFGMKNGYFIATNATSAFRSIVSSYPGKLFLVSIQCPNPDFNNPDHRWRMLQRSLFEAVVELLVPTGKVFLQSDIEAVSLRMKEEFLKYGKGRLIVHEESNAITSEGWLKENPFGVRSDWEQHVLDRGDPLYRVMLSKSTNAE